MMDLTEEELQEFKTEALELLDQAESELLALEKGGDYSATYTAVFRVFHSIKGGAGMLGMEALQSHMHQLESHYQECKSLKTLSPPLASYFLNGIDTSRSIIDGERPEFDYQVFEKLKTGQDQSFHGAVKPSTPTKTTVAPSSSTLPSSGTQPSPELLNRDLPTKDQTNVRSPVTSTASQKPTDQALTIANRFSGFNAGGLKVLAVDDEADLIEILSEILQSNGFDVLGLTSGKEALNQIKKFKPDVVLSDFSMPELGGMELLKAVREVDQDLPVIFLSGYLSKETLLDGFNHGLFGALEKPFKPEDVVMRCKNAAERYQVVKLLNRTISFIYYQYSDLDQYLLSKGATEVRKQVHEQFQSLIEAKRRLKFLSRNPNVSS